MPARLVAGYRRKRSRSSSIRPICDCCRAEPAAMEGQRARPIWAVLTGPYALFLVLLLVVPFASMAVFSLHPYSPTKIALPELTFDNYRQIAALYYLRLFGRTLQLSVVSTIICVVFGYPLAYVLARAGRR